MVVSCPSEAPSPCAAGPIQEGASGLAHVDSAQKCNPAHMRMTAMPQVASLPAAAWAALPGPAERAAYVLRLLQLAPKPSPHPGQAPAPAALPGSAPDTPTSVAPNVAPPPPPPPPPPPASVPTLAAGAGPLMGASGNPIHGQGPSDAAAATALLERLALQEGPGGVCAGVPMPGVGSGSSSGGLGYGGEASASEWPSGGSDTTNVPAGFPWQDQALLERCAELGTADVM